MSTPTEYRLLRQRHDRLREGIEALADRWERRADAVAITYQNPDTRRLAIAPARALVNQLRALLDQEDA